MCKQIYNIVEETDTVSLRRKQELMNCLMFGLNVETVSKWAFKQETRAQGVNAIA